MRSINWQDSATSITPPALRTNNFLMGHVCYHRQRDLRTTTTSTRVARAAHFVFFQIKMPRVGDAASESIGSRSLQCLIFHFSWSDSLDLRASRFSSHGWIIVGFFLPYYKILNIAVQCTVIEFRKIFPRHSKSEQAWEPCSRF